MSFYLIPFNVKIIKVCIYSRFVATLSRNMSSLKFNTITNDQFKTISPITITYGMGDSNFGRYLLAENDGNICHISFHDEGRDNAATDILKADWPSAQLTENTKKIQPLADRIFKKKDFKGLNVLLRGTELQCNVWKELTNVNEGKTTSYEQIAKAVGNPKAIRSVASAIAKNRIAYLIPCHRVIRKTGAPNKYRWGPERKIKMLEFEAEQ